MIPSWQVQIMIPTKIKHMKRDNRWVWQWKDEIESEIVFNAYVIKYVGNLLGWEGLDSLSRPAVLYDLRDSPILFSFFLLAVALLEPIESKE